MTTLSEFVNAVAEKRAASGMAHSAVRIAQQNAEERDREMSAADKALQDYVRSLVDNALAHGSA